MVWCTAVVLSNHFGAIQITRFHLRSATFMNLKVNNNCGYNWPPQLIGPTSNAFVIDAFSFKCLILLSFFNLLLRQSGGIFPQYILSKVYVRLWIKSTNSRDIFGIFS